MPVLVLVALGAIVAVAVLLRGLRAPAAPVQPQATTRRPKLVWVISILCVLGATRAILPLVLGPVSLALNDALLVVGGTILAVAGAVLLFMLRRQAFAFLLASWLIGVVGNLVIAEDLAAVVPDLARSQFVSQTLTIAALLYIYRLKRRGVIR